MFLQGNVDASNIAFTHVQLSAKMLFYNCTDGSDGNTNSNKHYDPISQPTLTSINCHSERLIAVSNAGDVFCVHFALRA